MTPEARRSAWIALGQVALVLLSVGLGFALAEWRQGRADDERAQLAMDAAVREIGANRELAATAYDYHSEMLEGFYAGEPPVLQLRAAPFVNSAWDMTQASGVVADLPYPVVGALARVHEMQTTYREYAQATLGVLYLENVFGSERLPTDALGYASSIEDLLSLEGTLVGLYDDALRTLDAHGFAVADSLRRP